ncbi:MAG: WD40/YVTN/BNR-like repeat-containing protein [Planctomycetota bacterium]
MRRPAQLPLPLLFALVLAPACAAPSSRVGRDDPDRAADAHHPAGIAQRSQQRRLADGTIPHDALVRAFERRMQLASVRRVSAAAPQWTWLGPENVGGRVRAILIHPTNPLRMWIGSAGGGVWRSDDGGGTWQPLNGLLTMLGCGCMALDPADPDHVLFGSGEGFFDANAGSSNTAILRGAGVFESFDAGLTWSRIPTTATAQWEFTNRLCYDPQNAAVLLAATGSGIWRSTDGGVSWSRRTTQRALDVDFHPTDGTRAIAGRSDGVVLRSTDGGLSWAPATGTFGTRMEVAWARSNPAVVYATGSDAFNEIHVFRSIDGGASFARTSLLGIATYSLYNNLLWVDPLNDTNILYGGVQLFASTDGGQTRTQTTAGAHADYHVVVEHPAYSPGNRRVYVANDGGIYTRPDWSTGTWTSLNQGLGITQFYGAAAQPSIGVIVAGAQDNGTNRFTGSAATWQRVIGGDGGFCAADPTHPTVFYGGFQRLGLYRSVNGGTNWTSIRGATTADTGFNFIPYFALDPNDHDRMYACGRSLWRADDVRTGTPPSWFRVRPERSCTVPRLADDAHFQDNAPCNHSTVAVALGDADVVWTGHNDGELYRSTDALAATPTWTLVDGAGGSLPDRWISSIAIDAADHDHVLVAFMGYAGDNLWETFDAGVTWRQRTGTGPGALPALPISWITMHPSVDTLWFAATDLGVWTSEDAGASWVPVLGGPENVCVEQLIWADTDDLLVVTHGQGAWMLNLERATRADTAPGCRPIVATLSSTPPRLGLAAELTMTTTRPAAPVLLSYSGGPPHSVQIGVCQVQVDLATAVSLFGGSTDATGQWTFAMPIPAQLDLIGARLTLQTLVFAAGGPLLGLGDLANGLDWQLGL